MKAFMGRAEQPWKNLAKIPEDFKQGYKKAQESMTQQGHDEARKAFMDRSGITRRADELNRGSATMGMPVDVNQTPGLYTGSRMEAPQGIGGAGGHFGVGGITMPETPGGLGVRGIRRGFGGWSRVSATWPEWWSYSRSAASEAGRWRVKVEGRQVVEDWLIESHTIEHMLNQRELDPDLVTGIVMGEGHKGPNDRWANPD